MGFNCGIVGLPNVENRHYSMRLPLQQLQRLRTTHFARLNLIKVG